MRDVRHKMSMGAVFTDVPAIAPDNVNPEKMKEKALPAVTPTQPSAPANDKSSRSKSPKRKQASADGEATPPAVQKQPPKEMGFFVPHDGCDYKKMFSGITTEDGVAKIPCFNHHAIGMECTHGRQCRYLHGSFVRFPAVVQKKILQNMLTGKVAHINPNMENSARFKGIVGTEFKDLWKSEATDAAESSEGA